MDVDETACLRMQQVLSAMTFANDGLWSRTRMEADEPCWHTKGSWQESLLSWPLQQGQERY